MKVYLICMITLQEKIHGRMHKCWHILLLFWPANDDKAVMSIVMQWWNSVTPKRPYWWSYCIPNDLCNVTDDQACFDAAVDYPNLLLMPAPWEIVRLYYGADRDLGLGRKTLAAGHCQRIDRIKDWSPALSDFSDMYKYCFCYLRICSRNPDCIQPFDNCQTVNINSINLNARHVNGMTHFDITMHIKA